MDNEGIKYSINSKYYPNPSTTYYKKVDQSNGSKLKSVFILKQRNRIKDLLLYK